MRTIKFRCWDNTYKRMLKNVTRIDFLSDGSIEKVYNYGSVVNTYPQSPDGKRIVLLQYTNIKDKNGVEIYEGDIIEVFGVKDEVKFGEWIGEGFYCLNAFNIGDDLSFCKADQGDYEVIGNIYQNPELLEEHA